MGDQLDLPDLADRAGVSIRTVRYYIQQGLLPKPEARGPGAHYTEEHLDRLLLVKRLQKEHLPLGEIRRRIETGGTYAEPPRSAREYISEVLNEPRLKYEEPAPATRSQWERITIAPDIELHIRRPLPRLENRKVERLLDVAREIFEEE
ncbi:MAG: MerR family transcriptional regulator [Gemmatimonadaceae bacterium]